MCVLVKINHHQNNVKKWKEKDVVVMKNVEKVVFAYRKINFIHPLNIKYLNFMHFRRCEKKYISGEAH